MRFRRKTINKKVSPRQELWGAPPRGPSSGCCNSHLQATCRCNTRNGYLSRAGWYICRQPDALHPEKREKMPVGESLLSLPAFSRFLCAREIAFLFFKLLAEKPRLFKSAPLHTGIQRRISSGEGYREREAPCLLFTSPVPPSTHCHR